MIYLLEIAAVVSVRFSENPRDLLSYEVNYLTTSFAGRPDKVSATGQSHSKGNDSAFFAAPV